MGAIDQLDLDHPRPKCTADGDDPHGIPRTVPVGPHGDGAAGADAQCRDPVLQIRCTMVTPAGSRFSRLCDPSRGGRVRSFIPAHELEWLSSEAPPWIRPPARDRARSASWWGRRRCGWIQHRPDREHADHRRR